MSADSGDRKIELEQLKTRRNQLFELLVEHPNDFRVSLEIKKLDDQIAGLTERRDRANRTKRVTE